jgi:hypothetical protein
MPMPIASTLKIDSMVVRQVTPAVAPAHGWQMADGYDAVRVLAVSMKTHRKQDGATC